MKARHGFASLLGPDIEQFIAHKRAAGRRFEVEEKTLRLLDDFLLERKVNTLEAVTSALIDKFLASRPRSKPRSYNHLRCTVGRLFAYLVGHGRVARNPLQSPPRRARYQRSPFIFDQTAARRLLASARALTDGGQHPRPRMDLSPDLRHSVWLGAARRRSVSIVREGCRSRSSRARDPTDQVLQESAGAFRSEARVAAASTDRPLQGWALWQCGPADRVVPTKGRAGGKSRHRQYHISAARSAAPSCDPTRRLSPTPARFASLLRGGNAHPLVSRWRRSPVAPARPFDVPRAR